MNAAVYFFYFAVVAIAAGGVTMRARVALVLGRLTGTDRTVSFTLRRPNCRASRVDGVQISILRPFIAPPVSATRYSPLQGPASSRTRVPSGRCLGSAAINPRVTCCPLAVRPRRLYAVAE